MSPAFPPREAVSRRPNPVAPGSFSFFAPQSRRGCEDFSSARQVLDSESKKSESAVGAAHLLTFRAPQRFIRLLPLTPPATPQNPQSTAFISHLTNSNPCGNIYTKVRLTVSPFHPPFPPQSDVYPKVQYCLPSKPTTHYPLFFTTPVFSSTCRLLGVSKKVNSFAIKQIQTLFRKHPGWGVSLWGAMLRSQCPLCCVSFPDLKLVTRHSPLPLRASGGRRGGIGWVWQPRCGKIAAQRNHGRPPK